MPGLDTLPSELYSAILDQLPSEFLQEGCLSLTRCLPNAPIPQFHLFQCVRLKSSDQVLKFYRRLRTGPDSAVSWVQDFSLEAWNADAEIVIDLIRLLPRLRSLNVFIGPSNFNPERLVEIFSTPIPGLKRLSLRFRPYVQRATYFQFLKGSYFDSTLVGLSKWPSITSLEALSIVQDALDPASAPTQAFAQPLVFFELEKCLPILLRSLQPTQLAAFRLRLPLRTTTRSLTAVPHALPCATLLDFSTCGITEPDVDVLLARFYRTQHLVLDGCPVIFGRRRDEWKMLGKRCALVGVQRAKQRERRLGLWFEEVRAQLAAAAATAASTEVNEEATETTDAKGKRGRKGLAASTISIRTHQSRASSSASDPPNLKAPKVRVLPPFPRLRSLCATSTQLNAEMHATVRREFEAGWIEGLAQLAATRARLRQSHKNGVRVMVIVDPAPGDSDVGQAMGYDGLEDVGVEEFTRFSGEDGDVHPLLCLAGPGRGDEHLPGCAHALGWDVWENDW
ncbi:hypothetical protein BD779DRAFT_1430784 [Infundibulicybe gibba]|nr:hypothetical protein BD779DRAFT_1430784 [Infundibulicybe gibba]